MQSLIGLSLNFLHVPGRAIHLVYAEHRARIRRNALALLLYRFAGTDEHCSLEDRRQPQQEL